jgi:hypothetical protein
LTDHLTPAQQRESNNQVLDENVLNPVPNQFSATLGATILPANGSQLSMQVIGAPVPAIPSKPFAKRGRPTVGIKRAAESQVSTSSDFDPSTVILPAKKLKSQRFVGRRMATKKKADPESASHLLTSVPVENQSPDQL